MADLSKINWDDDESVVIAVHSYAYETPVGYIIVWEPKIAGEVQKALIRAISWKQARQHSSVQAFESLHNPSKQPKPDQRTSRESDAELGCVCVCGHREHSWGLERSGEDGVCLTEGCQCVVYRPMVAATITTSEGMIHEAELGDMCDCGHRLSDHDWRGCNHECDCSRPGTFGKAAPSQDEVRLPELDIAYQCQKEYGLTLPTGADYSIIESNARAQCRERQLLAALQSNAALRAELAAMTEDRNLWRDEHDEDCPNAREVVALRAEVERLRKLADSFVNERDSELDMMTCNYIWGTVECVAWHDGVKEMWRVLDLLKTPFKAQLASLKASGKGDADAVDIES